MKLVSGMVESSVPISLSRAAKILSKFSASDNEASQAFGAYLKRTSAAFSELAQLHKNLKISDKVKKYFSDGNVTEGTANSAVIPQEDGLTDTMNKRSDSEMEKHVHEEGIDAGTENMVDKIKERNDARRSKKSMGVPSGEGSISRVVSDVGGAVKKSKKKSGSDEPDGEHDAFIANEVNHEMVDGIRESKKTKKRKSNRHEVERTKEILSTTGKDEADGDCYAFHMNKVNNEMVDGCAESKKTQRKKRDSCESERTEEILATAEKDEADGDHNALNVNKVMNEMVVGSEDAKNSKKKKKRDKRDVERTNEIVAICEKDDVDGYHNALIVTKAENEMVNESEKTRKTKRKKRVNHKAERTHEVVEIAEKAEAAGDPNAFNVKKVENEMVYGSEETKKTKRKKRDRHEVERSDGTVTVGNEVESHSNIQNDDRGEPALTVQNEGQEQKKHKKKNKKKEERERGSIINAEQRDDMILNDVAENSDVQERKKKNSNVENANAISDGNKQTHVSEQSRHGDKIDIGAAKKKDNGKGKHERSADGEFDAEEVHKSKKKRT